MRSHPVLGDGLEDFVTVWAAPLFVLATFSLWFLDRPGARFRWKVACLSGLAAAGFGLAVSQVIGHLWVRERPFDAHPLQTVLLAPASHEPSFPSDHAVAAFAIAFSVLFVGGRLAGALFLGGATIVAVTRIFVGLHYPGDVLGGIGVGLVAAGLIFFVGGGRWTPLVRLLSRLTDPLVAPVWRVLDARQARRRAPTTP
jgi:undecaprenyl-diphosphatase